MYTENASPSKRKDTDSNEHEEISVIFRMHEDQHIKLRNNEMEIENILFGKQ